LQLPLQQSSLLLHVPPNATVPRQVPDGHEPLQQSLSPLQLAYRWKHATVLEVLLDDDELDDDELDDDELDDDELVEVVALTHTVEVDVAKLDASGQFALQACPDGQHRRLDPDPQAAVPAGQPHRLWAADAHATPLLQQRVPHAPLPAGQQHDVDGFVQKPPWGQHPSPQAALPAGHVTAPPRNGRNKEAPTAASPAAPSTLSAPRRLVGSAIARDRSSKDPLTGPPYSRCQTWRVSPDQRAAKT